MLPIFFGYSCTRWGNTYTRRNDTKLVKIMHYLGGLLAGVARHEHKHS
jgi:hypothetical protein